jgi:hypothetical protein
MFLFNLTPDSASLRPGLYSARLLRRLVAAAFQHSSLRNVISLISFFSLRPSSFFSRLRLHGCDGDGVNDVFRFAAARKIVGGFV